MTRYAFVAIAICNKTAVQLVYTFEQALFKQRCFWLKHDDLHFVYMYMQMAKTNSSL